jgi:hypothetical protein
MAGAGKKTFTAGEVLTASDVNTYLMEQSVMYFGGTAARASAIPTPSTGMTTYIGTTGTATIPQIETYTGSAWQTPYGSTLLATVNLTGSSVIVNNIFSNTYNVYKIEMADVTFSQNGALQLQLRTGSTTSGSDYRTQRFSAANATISGDRDATTAVWNFNKDAIDNSNGTITLYNPSYAIATFIHAEMSVSSSLATNLHQISGLHSLATSYESMVLSPTGGTFTGGTMRVYGLRRA